MKKNEREDTQNKGITLITLVITIIVLLILAGISVALLYGENGLFKNTQLSRERTQISGYDEKIRIAITEENIGDYKRERTKTEALDEIKKILEKDKDFQEPTQIVEDYIDEENPRLIVKTKEGYIFYIYVDKSEYRGKREEVGDIELGVDIIEAGIKYKYNPMDWTNKEVKVEIYIEKEEYKNYKIEYSYDAEKWYPYKEQIGVTNNRTEIYARLTNGIQVTKNYSAGTVTNIDRIEPNDFTPTATSSTNSITVNASATDKEATDIDGCSGIEGYRFKLDEGEWTQYQESGGYTFNNLTQTTDYTITVEAKDKAGNLVQGTVTQGTGTIEEATGATYTPTNWTNGNVTVTLPQKEGYTTRYTTNGTAPTKDSTAYTAPFAITTNSRIYYIYTDGTNIGGAGTANITNIDKTKPIINEQLTSSNVTTKGFTLNISATDTKSGLGKTIWYYKLSSASSYTSTEVVYTALNGSTTGETTKQTKTKEITNLTSGTYKAYAEVYDVAGNKETSEEIEITTGTVTAGTVTGAIKFGTPTWSGGKASTKISTNTTYTIQWQVDGTDENKWATGTTATGASHGSEVYARLWDGTNAGTYATYNVKDGTAPSAPTISVTAGTAGTNGWYTSNVTVKITAGTDNQSGIDKTEYTLTGATTKEKTTITSGGTFTITAEGATTITAYTYDKAGNESAAKTSSIKVDKTAPTQPSILVGGSLSGGYYKIMTNGSDDGVSKINSYGFSSDGGNNYNFDGGLQTSLTVNITAGFSRSCVVVAIDNAGNLSFSTRETINAKMLLIGQLYEGILGRGAEPAGNTYWLNSVGNCAEIAKGIARSQEAEIIRTNIGNTEYVKRVYKGILGHDGDAGGISYWANDIASSNSTERFVKNLINSDEFKNLCSKYGLTYTALP